MALCYNFSRVLNILGLDGLMAHLASRSLCCMLLLLYAVLDIVDRPRLGPAPFRAKIRPTLRLAG